MKRLIAFSALGLFLFPCLASDTPPPVLQGIVVSNGVKTVTFTPAPAIDAYTVRSGSNVAVQTNDSSVVLSGATFQVTNSQPMRFYSLGATPMTSNDLLSVNLLNRIAYGPTPDELVRVRTEAARVRTEAARTLALNSELQRKLLDQSSQMKDLAVQRVAEVTGGDGFAYLDLGAPAADSSVSIQAKVNGSYHLRQVKYRIAEGGLVELGDLGPRATRLLDTVLQPSREAGAKYKITIQAANGPVQEDLELRFNPAGKRWERRVKVSRGEEVLLERGWGR